MRDDIYICIYILNIILYILYITYIICILYIITYVYINIYIYIYIYIYIFIYKYIYIYILFIYTSHTLVSINIFTCKTTNSSLTGEHFFGKCESSWKKLTLIVLQKTFLFHQRLNMNYS